MNKLFAGAIALILMCGAAMAQDIAGDWRTAADDNGNTGLIRVAPCGDAYCGVLIQAYDASGNVMESENVGRQIIWDTRLHSGTEYRGRLYSPDRDSTYNSRLQLNGNTLVVSGCRLGICREGGRWSRVN